MYDRRKIKNSVRGTGSVKPRSPVQRFVGRRRAVFGSFEDPVKGGQIGKSVIKGNMGDTFCGVDKIPDSVG